MTSRLRLRSDVSILRLPDGGIQIGLDVETPVVLPDAPPHAEAALMGLRRGLTAHEFADVVPGLPHSWARITLATLTHQGLTTPWHHDQPSAVIVGSGAVADAVAATLEPGTPLVAPHSWRPESHPGKLVLVCPETPEPDRVLTRELTISGRTHLVLHAEPERAIVGPLVTPDSACLTCTDLIRRDLDPAWPHLLLQLCRTTAVPHPSQTAWIAGMAAAQVRAWSAGFVPDTWGTTIELSRADGSLGTRSWARRLDCAAHAAAHRCAA